jgi:hypothetical protein
LKEHNRLNADYRALLRKVRPSPWYRFHLSLELYSLNKGHTEAVAGYHFKQAYHALGESYRHYHSEEDREQILRHKEKVMDLLYQQHVQGDDMEALQYYLNAPDEYDVGMKSNKMVL